MKRDIDQYLKQWQTRPLRKPLIIHGARQVGKTWSVDTFSAAFSYYVKIDFEAERDAISIFRDNSIERILQETALFTGVPIIEGQTLVFFDECQLCPGVLKALRYFYEKKPGLHVIAAGSLLDIAFNELQYPIPVGRVEFLYMYPLSFCEFLTALGKDNFRQFIESFHVRDGEIPPAIHNQLLELLRFYYFIGGMPEAVAAYVKTKDLLTIQRIQTELVTSMQTDIVKYTDKKEQQYLLEVFFYAARNSGRKIKYSNIDSHARSELIKAAITYLKRIRIIHKITHSHGEGVPLGAQVKSEHFKTAFVDIGLSNRVCGLDLLLPLDMLTIREGLLAEQFAAQELVAAQQVFEESELYYWVRQSKNSNAEVDYLISAGNRVVPLEIKSGTAGSLKSLHIFMAQKKAAVYAVRCDLNPPTLQEVSHKVTIEKEGSVVNFTLINLPLYMISQVKRIVKELQ